jgi:hypothetical protein
MMQVSSQTTLRYPARGAAAGWEQSLPPNASNQALRDLLGAPRTPTSVSG